MDEEKNEINNYSDLSDFDVLKKENISLKKDLDFFKSKSEENFDLYLRAKAEIDNIRKRTDKEIDNILKYSNKKIILDLLPLMDSLDSCLKNNNTDKDREGLLIFQKMLKNIFIKNNVNVIDADYESDFDPLKHEVVSTLNDSNIDNKISEVLQTGYMLNDQVLRYAKVIVFKKN